MKNSIKFLPLLLVYIFIVSITYTDNFIDDEGRYVMYATNLSNGFYSPLNSIRLANGPGYPMVLLPFVTLKLPWLAARLMNPLFLFIAIVYFYFTLCLYMKERPALFFSYLLGLYIPFYRSLSRLLTDHLAIFLVCAFMFHLCKLHQEDENSWTQLLISSVYLGFLALTKVLFGYVILIGLLMYLILYIWKKRRSFKKTFLVYLLALLYCVPYLLYTYSLTGNIFYWASAGGENLYYMSSPYEGELGDWSVHKAKSKYHMEFRKELQGISHVERDAKFKKQAVKNIIDYPAKYLYNWIANVSRLFFNYPYSYRTQRLSNYFYFVPNMFLVVFSVLCLFPAYKGRSQIPFAIYTLIFFTLISFGGLSLQSSEQRYLWPLVPIFMLWISFTLARILKIEIQR
jgi:4-amino-4-deoxy-L-arabinose transferase-like glycosyltransferase